MGKNIQIDTRANMPSLIFGILGSIIGVYYAIIADSYQLIMMAHLVIAMAITMLIVGKSWGFLSRYYLALITGLIIGLAQFLLFGLRATFIYGESYLAVIIISVLLLVAIIFGFIKLKSEQQNEKEKPNT